jgi:uncharacterized protein
MAIERLKPIFETIDSPAIAVSGGVDSITLAHVATSLVHCGKVVLFHAISPAVPASATKRVENIARQKGWSLKIIEAGEFSDPRYRDNPLNRCYFCKSNLYTRIRQHTDAVILSGTNLDDLGDFRPGLLAASEAGVRHPFVEAKVTKREIRQIARANGLGQVSELPAQPCLASRVETGIAIAAKDLALAEEVEAMIAAMLGPGNIRCRITRNGVRLELPQEHLGKAQEANFKTLLKQVSNRCNEAGRVLRGHEIYRQGSAFIKDIP